VEPASRKFRWPRALLHVVLVTFAANGTGLAFAAAGLLDARKWGAMSVDVVLWSGLFTLLASYGKQTGRPVLFGLGALLAAASAFGWIPIFLIASRSAHERARLTAAETAAFEKRGAKLCQPALGVELADPGDALEPDPELTRRYNEVMAQYAWLHSWVWSGRRTGHGGLLHLQVAKEVGPDWSDFAAYIPVVRNRVVRPEATVESEIADSGTKPYRYRLALRLKGASLDVYCTSTSSAEPLPLIVCAETVALDHEALRGLRESVAAGGCR
jgi:hypothetical protein